MSKENNGGHVYPRQLPDVEVPPSEALDLIERYSGMTLRDYYIGQALAGICANPSKEWYGAKPSDMADAAVIIADEAIKSREA